ncbi:MAG: HDIG domain-containing protein [Muribaculaceae bacterium]|nr:HDIG domain-containing protein [Muribaculaceae bacterium]
MVDYNSFIDKYYESGSRLREILILHSRQVADMALAINADRGLGLDPAQVEAAAMLHDVGICRCDAPGIECHGSEPYIMHGVIGARMLRQNGMPEWAARVAERHTGAGLSPQDIAEQRLPLPPGDYMPRTQLERLICYADKFYSKSGSMERKPLEAVRRSMLKHGPETLSRFDALHNEFGA